MSDAGHEGLPGFVPAPTPVTRPFWDGAARGELMLQYCIVCAEHYFYPRSFCPKCSGRQVEWRTVSGRGRLASYVVARRQLPIITQDLPLIVALVELDEGPRLMTNVVGVDPDAVELALGTRLVVGFERRSDMVLPVFRLEEPAL